MITHRPCGVCRALVPPTGCKHWHPVSPARAAAPATKPVKKQRTGPVTEAAKRRAAEVEQAKRERNSRAKRRERAAAREEAVAELTRALVPRPPVPAKRPPIVQRAAPVPRLRRTSTDNPIGASVADLERAMGRSFR